MIPESQSITIERENVGKEASFKMEANAHIMRILRDGIYSNKILACVREYSINALEAHMLNGNQEVPIEVTLPNYIDPMLKIRDFGPGLTFKQIHNLICSYGATTKDKSNDFVGCFGIGSKAAFSYSNTFQITSVCGGKKSIYNAYIDETEVGKISELLTEKSDELSGIEIGIPVKVNDISSFIKEANNLFRFWKIQPVIKGNSTYSPIANKYILRNDLETWAFMEKDSHYETCFLVMGGVPYRINAQNIPNLDGLHASMLSKSLVLFANIGDVTIAASREEISYTPKTVAYIKEVLRTIESEIKKQIDDKFANCKSEYETRQLYYQCFQGGTLDSVLNKAFFSGYSVKFNGKDINTCLFQIQKDSKFNAVHNFNKETGRRSYIRRFKAHLEDTSINFFDEKIWKVIPPEGIMFYYIGEENGKLTKKLMKYYFTEQYPTNDGLNVTVLNFSTDQDRIDWFAETGVPENLFKELHSTIIIPKKARKTPEPRQKNPKTNCIVFDAKNALVGKTSQHYDNIGWRFYDVDIKNEGGLYVIKHYSNIFLDSESRIRGWPDDESRVDFTIVMLREISQIFIDNPIVYAFNESDVKKLNSNWIPLADLAKEALQEQHNKFDTAKIPLGSYGAYGAEQVFYSMYQKKLISLKEDNPLHNLIEDFAIGEYTTIKRYDDMALYFKINSKNYDTNKIDRFKRLVQKELIKYPLLGYLTSALDEQLADIALYMKAKDTELALKKQQKDEKTVDLVTEVC